jgi:hypothetical protein
MQSDQYLRRAIIYLAATQPSHLNNKKKFKPLKDRQRSLRYE